MSTARTVNRMTRKVTGTGGTTPIVTSRVAETIGMKNIAMQIMSMLAASPTMVTVIEPQCQMLATMYMQGAGN